MYPKLGAKGTVYFKMPTSVDLKMQLHFFCSFWEEKKKALQGRKLQDSIFFTKAK